MANRQQIESSSRMPKSTFSRDVHLHVYGVPLALDRELLAAKSAKLAELVRENPQEDVSRLLQDIPADLETIELITRFCHGFEVNISTENVIRLCCLASYLGMTENHSPNNLVKMSLAFFEQKVIPCWNKSVRALKNAENVFQQAVDLGLVDACAHSIISKVEVNPCLLGEPVKNLTSDDDDDGDENAYKPNARRRLFDLDWGESEDLTILCIQLYEPIIRAMIQRQVPPQYVSASLCQYAKKWVFSSSLEEEDDKSFDKRNSQRQVIEAVERLLPVDRGLLSCNLLSEMLRFAVALGASPDCTSGFELRIGKQLDQANVDDLLIPCLGYAREEKYNTECVKQILKHYYCNYSDSDASGIIAVAQLVEDFLARVASDIELKMSTFISLADMAFAASIGTQRSSDGIYRAISIYLDKHRYLTESEREEVCRVLDCSKMSLNACQHAATNDQLPIRVVVQVLFVHQLQLRDTVTKELQSSDEGEEIADGGRSGEEDEVRAKMEKMSNKVIELERECSMMRNEIQGGCCNRPMKEKGSSSIWKEMKRKFGCIITMHNCDCHVKKKKVHPR